VPDAAWGDSARSPFFCFPVVFCSADCAAPARSLPWRPPPPSFGQRRRSVWPFPAVPCGALYLTNLQVPLDRSAAHGQPICLRCRPFPALRCGARFFRAAGRVPSPSPPAPPSCAPADAVCSGAFPAFSLWARFCSHPGAPLSAPCRRTPAVTQGAAVCGSAASAGAGLSRHRHGT